MTAEVKQPRSYTQSKTLRSSSDLWLGLFGTKLLLNSQTATCCPTALTRLRNVAAGVNGSKNTEKQAVNDNYPVTNTC